MNKQLLVVGILFLCLLSFYSVTSALNIKHNNFKLESEGEAEWDQTFGGSDYDEGYCVEQTVDGGYILIGGTLSFGAGNWDVWLLKTDTNGNEEWNATFGGSNYDKGFSVRQTTDGGYIIAGCTHSYGLGEVDVWLIKTDSNGNEEWNATFGGTSNDWGYSVQQTIDNGYVITGYTNSYGAGNSDVWLIKTDSNGYKEWDRTFGGSDYDRGFSIQQTIDNGYILSGYTVSFDADGSGCDVWLIKTDSEGYKEWDRTFGGTGIPNKFDMGYSVEQSNDGGYIIVGDTERYFVSEADILLIKTDSNGNEQWSATFGGSSADRGRSVQQTTDDGYIIAGWVSSFGPGDSDVWLVKTDSNGMEEWNATYRFEQGSLDWGYSVQQTTDSGYIIVGATMPDGWISKDSKALTTEEATDVWLIKTKSSDNGPPEIPLIPDGPPSVYAEYSWYYITSTTDPEGHDVFYMWDWGDETTGWIGPYASGDLVTESHMWSIPGNYGITVKAKDDPDGDGDPSDGLESNWSDPLQVTVKKPGDVNGDGIVNVEDLLALLASWGEPGGPADINGDGIVDVVDLLILLENWG